MLARGKMGWCVILLLMLLYTTGCTSAYKAYSGPPRQEAKIAVITPDNGVRIHALNDKVVNVKPGKAKGLYTTYNRIHVRPGQHTLTVIPQGIDMVKTYTKLTVRVEAGKHYRVRSQYYPGERGTPGHYKLWVDNKQTGAVVSPVAESRNPFKPRE